MADNEKMFNTYPVAEAINDDDLGHALGYHY